MPSQRIGNWEVSEAGVAWKGEPQLDYVITTERLTEAGPESRSNKYDWLVHLVEKTWLTETDIYALNTALIYAIEMSGQQFPKGLSFVETFKEQQMLLRRKQ
jgi:hypothetical protein